MTNLLTPDLQDLTRIPPPGIARKRIRQRRRLRQSLRAAIPLKKLRAKATTDRE